MKLPRAGLEAIATLQAVVCTKQIKGICTPNWANDTNVAQSGVICACIAPDIDESCVYKPAAFRAQYLFCVDFYFRSSKRNSNWKQSLVDIFSYVTAGRVTTVQLDANTINDKLAHMLCFPSPGQHIIASNIHKITNLIVDMCCRDFIIRQPTNC